MIAMVVAGGSIAANIPVFAAPSAEPLTVNIKQHYTAMVFNTSTAGLVDRFKGTYGVPKLESLIISPGGIPITIAGNIMGGIGVSGAPSGLTDEACALAGLAAVRDDLELE